jgi:hypothetical protein
MKTFLAFLLLGSSVAAFAQAPPADTAEKAPPEVDQALRGRIDQYYGAFVAGKFKQAYMLVADDSQDAFIESAKEQYKGCETVKIRYTDNLTKAIVVESCKSEWRWHGMVTPTAFPITSTWKIEDGKWVWSYVKPTQVPSPFSPTGFITVTPADASAKDAIGIPKDMQSAAQGILAKVTLDKPGVRLQPDQNSQDVIHIHNGMPGEIRLRLDKLEVPGLKITLAKATLGANEDTTVTFDYRLDDPGIACIDCAKKIQGTPVVALYINPTGQTFSIPISFKPAGPVHYHQQELPPPQH